MPTIKEVWPDKWLKASHIEGRRPRVVIESAAEELYNPRTRKLEPKLVVTFYGKTLRLICNKTQGRALAAICGSDDYTRWVGHEVVLSAATARNGLPTIQIDAAHGDA